LSVSARPYRNTQPVAPRWFWYVSNDENNESEWKNEWKRCHQREDAGDPASRRARRVGGEW
ncbi:MAG: hypothetical protein DSY88_08495, partial [Candidatus Poseidoniales archaeon]